MQKNQQACWDKMNLDSCISSCTKIKSQWIKDLDFTSETMNLLKDKIGKTLEDRGNCKDFLSRIPIVLEITPRFND